MPQINSLPEDVLWLILERLPLRELIRLQSQICTQWQSLISQIMLTNTELHLFEFRHEVKAINRAIFERNMDKHGLDEKVLLLNNEDPEGFDPAKAQELTTLFPNLKILGFSFKESIEAKIPLMLEEWSETLTTLIIADLPKSPTVLQQFWKKLVLLSKLINLHLVRTFRYSIPEEVYPIFPHLKSFSVVHYLSNLVPILSQLTSITELSIYWVYLCTEQMAKAIEMNNNLKQLEKLNMGFIFSQGGDREKNYQHLLWFICQNFKALKKIDVMYGDQLKISNMLHCLSGLTSLEELWLYCGRLEQAELTNSLPQLPTVTNLKLELFELTVDQFFTFTSHTFPNLESFTLRAPDFDEAQQAEILARFTETFPKLKTKKIKFA